MKIQMRPLPLYALSVLAYLPATHAADLEEVVVTAQKTSEQLNSIPISISAISAAALQQQNITTYEDLARAVPNLSFTNFGGAGQSNIEIRGIASQAGSATTGIYLDEVPINVQNIYTTGATEPRFFDIDRVEVLRGPQGTIYGASSMGGTLHFVSKAPNLHDYSADAHLEVGGTQGGGVNYESDGVVNLPLVPDKAALRVGTLYDHESGWINRVDPAGNIVDRRINDNSTTVVRAALEFRPVEGLSIEPAVFLQRVSSGGQDLYDLSLPGFESSTLVREAARDEYAITSLTVGYDLGWSDLTSVTGYFWRRDDRMIDGTFYDSVFLGGILQDQFGFGGEQIGSLAAPSKFNTNVNQIHQELRLSSKPAAPGDRWSWIAGLYYARTRTGLVDDEHIPGFNSTFAAVYNDTPENVLGAAFPNDLIYYASTQFISTQKAVFGQATYELTPALKLTAGARYEKANESLSFSSAGFFSGGDPFAGTAGGSKTTPKIAASYEIAPESMIYASAAEGFRDGGINRPVPIPLCSADLAGLGYSDSPGSYSADHLWSYEIGAKSRALNGSLSVSGALFDIRWNNIQTDILLPTCTFDVKVNIGSAESRGGELELRQQVTDRFNLTLGGNYTSAKITVPVTLLGVEKGDHVPGVPEWSVSTGAEYDAPLSGELNGFARANAQWTGKSQGVIFHNDPDFNRPSYLVTGMSAGVKAARYEVSFFISNLLNEDKAIQRPNIAAVEYGLRVRPRTFGLSASYHY